MLFRNAEGNVTFLGLKGSEITAVKQGLLKFVCRTKRLEHKFVDEWSVREHFLEQSGLHQLGIEIMSAVETELVDPLHSFRTHKGKIYRAPQCKERLV